jgi:cytochrome P450
MLAMHPSVQDKVYEEIKSIIDLSNADIKIDSTQLNELIYTENVIKETMRLFPVVNMISRETTNDGVVLSNGVSLPAGVNIVLDIFNLHRDESIWGPDANEFNPDRFSDNIMQNRHPYSYIPFSAGPKICLGYKYAWFSMKVQMVHLLKHFVFETSLKMENIELKYEIFLKPISKFLVRLIERNEPVKISSHFQEF